MDSSTLTYSDKGKKMGCAIVFFLLFGLVLFAGTSGYLWLLYDEGTLTSVKITYASPFLMFSLLAIFGPLANLKFSYRYQVVIDKSSNTLKFSKEDKNEVLEIPFSEFSSIRLLKTRENVSSSGGSKTYNEFYHIFLVMKDGSHFWLKSTTSKEKFHAAAQELKSFLDIPVNDEVTDLTDDGGTTYPKKSKQSLLPEPSRFVKTGNTNGMDFIRIKKPRYLIDDINGVLSLLFLVSLLSLIFEMTSSSSGLASIFIGGTFTIFFILIALLVIFINNRQYEVFISEGHMIIRLSFPLAILNEKFGRTIEIPKDEILQIRTSRLHEGHFWLSCNTKKHVSLGTQILFGAGAFGKSKIKSLGSENVIGLWEVPNYAKKNKMANHQDLYYIEAWIQEKLGLEETEIT